MSLPQVGLLINARSTVDVDFLESSAVYSGLDAETQVVLVGRWWSWVGGHGS